MKKEWPMRNMAKVLLIAGGVAAGFCWMVRCRRSRNVEPDQYADVMDSALIDASPDVAYRAVVEEHDGKTSWWAPHLTMQLRGGDSYGDVGALVDNTVRVHGRFPVRFTTKTVEVEPIETIRVEYVAGAFRGEAQWGFVGVNDGTELSQRWRTRPAGVLRALAPLLPIGESHSDTMKVGFERLRGYLDQTLPDEKQQPTRKLWAIAQRGRWFRYRHAPRRAGMACLPSIPAVP
jgi:hypothetical protein